MVLTADPDTELIVIGSTDAERVFLKTFFPGEKREGRAWRLNRRRTVT